MCPSLDNIASRVEGEGYFYGEYVFADVEENVCILSVSTYFDKSTLNILCLTMIQNAKSSDHFCLTITTIVG